MTTEPKNIIPIGTPSAAEPLAIIPKGKTRCIVVRLATFKGNTRLDIREHYQGDNGEWLPTKSGVTMPADERVGLLIDAIQQAQDLLAGGAA